MGAFSELVFGFLFWTLVSTCFAQIWFFPLEYMDLTGYEAMVLLVLAGPVLASQWGRVARAGRNVALHVVAAAGLVGASLVQGLVLRTALLAPSAGLCSLATAARWPRASPWLGWAALLVMLDRLHGYSRSSIWSVTGGSALLLAATLLAALLSRQEDKDADADGSGAGLLASLSLGSLLFLFHWFALQASVLPRWLDLAVMPTSLTVGCGLIVGMALPVFLPGLLQRYAMPVAPLLFAAWMLATPTQASVFAFACSIASLWLPVSGLSSHATVGPALLVYFVHFLGSIWTVAYNFVPVGGETAREQTRVHLYIACGLAGAVLALQWRPWSKRERPLHAVLVALLCLLLLGAIASVRLPAAASVPVRAAEQAKRDGRELRSMIWAVHFGYDNHGRNSFESVESVIRQNNVNVIGLLESDLARPFNDNWDLVDWLSNRLGMYADYGPSTLNNTWGCALLSVFPIVRSHRILLPSPLGELACLLDATLNVTGKHVHVLVTHFGNYRDAIDRELQTAEVAAMLKRSRSGSPHVFLGYLTNKPFSEHYNALTNAGWVDSAPHVLNRWCQYIFYRDLVLTKFSRFDTGDISDTEAQIAHFQVKSS